MRLTIIGNSGAGKSTVAVMLGKEFNLPIYHLDKILWKPGWERTPEDEFVVKHQEIIDKEHWVLDGVAYKSTYEKRFDRAEIIIYLDTSIDKCKERAQKRMDEEKIRPNPYVSENCPYEGDIEDNFKVIRLFHNEYRPLILKQLERYEKKTIVLSDFNFGSEKDQTNLISEIKAILKSIL